MCKLNQLFFFTLLIDKLPYVKLRIIDHIHDIFIYTIILYIS